MSDSAQGGMGQGKPENPFAKWFESQPMLAADNRGSLLRNVIAFATMGLAVLIALFFLLNWCRMIPQVRYMSFLEGLGYILNLLGWLAGVFLALLVMVYRGWQIRKLPKYDMVFAPILAVMAGMWGEMISLFLVILSIPSMLAIWCDSHCLPVPLLLWQGDLDNRFFGGLALFLSCCLSASIALIVGRGVKDWIVLSIRTGQEVGAIRGK